MAIGCESHSQCYARGHCSPLRPTFPPLRTPHGFACSVASLSRCPCHYRPGRRNFRRAALVERPLGQGKPSTRSTGHNADCCAPPATPHLGYRKALPIPGVAQFRSISLQLTFSPLRPRCWGRPPPGIDLGGQTKKACVAASARVGTLSQNGYGASVCSRSGSAPVCKALQCQTKWARKGQPFHKRGWGKFAGCPKMDVFELQKLKPQAPFLQDFFFPLPSCIGLIDGDSHNQSL